jgi:hypothetical protein
VGIMQIDISKLPPTILRQLPVSLRTYKSVYEFEQLPARIQNILKNYLEETPKITYSNILDLRPDISEYSDFQTIDNYNDLVAEYIKNYLQVLPGTYPFDPTFGCRLRQQIQTKDTNLRRTLITSEIDNIILAITTDLNANIKVTNLSIVPVSEGAYTEFNVKIELMINDTYKNINLEFR